jgi:diguanylate cyclase
MEFSVPIFVVILLLGVVQLAAGVVLGRCLPLRRSGETPAPPGDQRRLRHFARRLFELVTSVADDVDRHQTQIRQANRELDAVRSDVPSEGGGLSEFVLKTVAQIMQINERLQSRLDAAEAKLQQQSEQIEARFTEARTDPLTGLPNRRAFDDEMVRRVAEWRRKRNTFCLAMVDVDRFKELNDRHGHPAGDHVLRNLAEVLKRIVREMDVVARVGGEEFAVILPSTNAADARRAVERMRSAIASETFRFEQAELRVHASLGLAAVQHSDDSISLLRRADEALYAAKRGGRNCGYFHNGRTCERIRPGREPDRQPPAQDAAPAPEDPGPGDAAELAALSEDLRKRLTDLAGQP